MSVPLNRKNTNMQNEEQILPHTMYTEHVSASIN